MSPLVQLSAQRYSVAPAAAARQFLAEHWDGNLPVNPFALARAAGLTVTVLPDGAPYSGRYVRGTGTIEINVDEPEVRQRFTAAHEIGHHVLNHADSPRDTLDEFSSRNFDPKERAANQFAAELLMPTGVMRKYVDAGRYTVDELARVFKVSKVAMTYRINNLNLG